VPVNADIKYSYALGAGTPAFITLVPQGAGRPKISIYTTDSANTGIYSINFVLTEVFSTLVITDTFVVTVSCVQSISMTASIGATTYYIADPMMNVSIPLFGLTPSTCPYELVYSATLTDGVTPLPAPITLANVSGNQVLQLFSTDPAATGIYIVRIKVVDPKTGQTNTSLTASVTIKCTKSISLVANPIPATTTYTINTSILKTTSFSLPTYQPSPSNCAIGTLSFQVALDPVSAFPTFITQFPSTKIDLATTDASKAGTYNFRVTVTDSLTGLQNNAVTF